MSTPGRPASEVFRRADDDTGRVDLVDDARAPSGDGGAGIAGHNAFHAGADQRRIGAHQRHGLTLHVRAHQRAVGVIVLEERDQRRGDRNQLLGRHVHEVDAVAGQQHHVAGVAADDEVFGQVALVVELRRWPGRPNICPLPSPTDRRLRR